MMRVLLLDDERMEREGLRYLFGLYHYSCRFFEARNGIEALELLEREVVDLVITDIKMPEMDGIRFLLKAKEKYPDLIYIIYSGYSDFAYAKEAISLGVIEYLVKPVNENEFRDVIERVHKLLAARQENQSREAKIKALSGNWTTEIPGEIGAGHAVAFYLGLPVLEEHSEEFNGMVTDSILGSEVYIQNEQEGHILISDEWGTEQLEAGLDDLCRLVPEQLGTFVHFLLLPQYTNARTLAESVRKGEVLMSRRFFANRSLVVKDVEARTDEMFHIFADIETSQEAGEINHAEALRLMLEALRERLPFTNLYTKYSMLKRLENLNVSLEPREIEAFMQADSYEELMAIIRGNSDYGSGVPRILPGVIFEDGGAGCREKKSNPDFNSVNRGDTARSRALEERFDAEDISGAGGGESRVISKARQFMMAHYGETLTLERIAAEVYLNPNYFCQLFKKQTGKTVITYLTDLRLTEATRLLARPELRLGEIARKLGYSNPSYFNMIFKNRYGVTPGAYRESLEENAR